MLTRRRRSPFSRVEQDVDRLVKHVLERNAVAIRTRTLSDETADAVRDAGVAIVEAHGWDISDYIEALATGGREELS